MITAKDISRAVIKTVTEGLEGTDFENVEFSSTDIKEGFDRPSFFLELSESKKGLLNSNRVKRQQPVRLYYFPKDASKPKLELMSLQDLLENMFLAPLKIIDDFSVLIEETDSVIADGVLQFSFELITHETFDKISNENEEYADTLELK